MNARERVLRDAIAYLADPLYRPGTGENHCRECRQTVKYCDADDARRLSDKGRCAGAVAREALAAADAIPDAPVGLQMAASYLVSMSNEEYRPKEQRAFLRGVAETVKRLDEPGGNPFAEADKGSPVPAPMTAERRAELVEMMANAWGRSAILRRSHAENAASVLDALIKAGAVR